jgi:hypothetical protein
MNRFANALSLLASRNNFICQRLAASPFERMLEKCGDRVGYVHLNDVDGELLVK